MKWLYREGEVPWWGSTSPSYIKCLYRGRFPGVPESRLYEVDVPGGGGSLAGVPRSRLYEVVVPGGGGSLVGAPGSRLYEVNVPGRRRFPGGGPRVQAV